MSDASVRNQLDEEHFKVEPQLTTYINSTSDCHIFDTKWIPTYPTKFVIAGAAKKASTKGSIRIFHLSNDKVEVEKVIEKKVAFRCATFDAIVRNTSISLGNFHGDLQIYDIERVDFPMYNVVAHQGIVNCIDGIGGDNGAPEIVTGGQDGYIKIWDPRQGEAVVCISAISEKDGGSGARDCWSVSFANGFSQEDLAVCAGFDNGDIKVIDLRQMKERWSINLGSGVCKVSCKKKHENVNTIVAGTVDGSVHLFDMRNSELDKNCEDHIIRSPMDKTSTVWCVNYLPQNSDIFSTCIGGSVAVWQHDSSLVQQSTKKEKLEMLTKNDISAQPINSFDWNPDFRGLGLCGSFDGEIQILVSSDI